MEALKLRPCMTCQNAFFPGNPAIAIGQNGIFDFDLSQVEFHSVTTEKCRAHGKRHLLVSTGQTRMPYYEFSSDDLGVNDSQVSAIRGSWNDGKHDEGMDRMKNACYASQAGHVGYTVVQIGRFYRLHGAV